MKRILFISPHPDDETLGCGGVIQKHRSKKDKIYWLNFTDVSKNNKYLKINIARNKEIVNIKKFFKFDKFINLNLEPTYLDSIPFNEIVNELKKKLEVIKPNIIYFPHPSDSHTDHQVVYKAVKSCTKWFRLKYIEKLLLYETLSETNFSYDEYSFKPNEFHDVTKFFKGKLKAIKIYKSEIHQHPFPRNIEVIEALAKLRGSQSGFKYAEAFQSILNIIK